MKHRSIALIAIATQEILIGVWGLFRLVTVFAKSEGLASLIVVGTEAGLIAMLGIGVGVGLLRFRPLARRIALIISIGWVVCVLVSIVNRSPLTAVPSAMFWLLTIAFNLLSIWYLLRPEVQAQFEAKSPERTRLKGVSIYGCLFLFLSIITMAQALAQDVRSLRSKPAEIEQAVARSAPQAVVLAGLGSAGLVSAVGIALLHNWGRLLTLMLAVAWSVTWIAWFGPEAVQGVLHGNWANAFGSAVIILFGIAWNANILFYFNDPNVKAQFVQQ